MIMRTHLHQTSSHLIPCLQVCPGLNQSIHHGGVTTLGSEMEGCTTNLMKYKHKQTCRVRAAQRPTQIDMVHLSSTPDGIAP